MTYRSWRRKLCLRSFLLDRFQFGCLKTLFFFLIPLLPPQNVKIPESIYRGIRNVLDGHHTPELAKVRDDKAQSLARESRVPPGKAVLRPANVYWPETAKNKTFNGW